ncbi:MAG: AbrB/MazE/SpoVT family DNA-binding domain-containing protein [Acidimicrobiaceae bacterium]|nr:AbrB/MazE/SpoVT family DNA-binding domain-containing protein [Acidimicrobiaceae bacterium]
MERIVRISERGRITIPKSLRDRFGLDHEAEVDIIPTEQGLLLQKRTSAQHPVERVYGILDGVVVDGVDVDDYIEDIRGQ